MATSFAKYFFSSEPRIDDEIRIVLVGKTGVGKSASGNTILAKDCFKSKFSFMSLTEKCAKVFGSVDGHNVAVIDTPGLFDTKINEEKTKQHIAQSISYASPGPHIFLVVIKLDRYTDEEKKTVQKIQEIFGEEADKHSMVLFTNGDKLEGKPIEEFLKESKELQDVVSRCNGQYHVFNNKLEDRSQVRELLNKIRNITEKNGGSHYTTEMFQKAEKKIEEEKQRILKENEEQRRKEQEELTKEMQKKHEEDIKKMKADMEKREKQLREDLEIEKQRREAAEIEKQLREDLEIEKQRREAAEIEKQLREEWERQLEKERTQLRLMQERKARREAENNHAVKTVIGAGLTTGTIVAAASLCCIS